MKLTRYSSWIPTAIVLIATAFCFRAGAIQEVSNLGDQWPINGSIGDIQAFFPGGSSDTAQFTTGASAYALNSLTLEFEFHGSYSPPVTIPPGPGSLSLQLFLGSTLLGTLANPAINPTPTQWPESTHPGDHTTFIDFTPTTAIRLGPNSKYSLVISMPANSGVDAALMYTRSPAYISSDDWVMYTATGGDYLKFAVGATKVPDQANTAILLGAGLLTMVWCQRKFGRKIRSKPLQPSP
jgi:hypothetical protein